MATEVPAPVSRPDAAPTDGHRRVILVVDDDADTRELLSRRLARLGYAPVSATDGLQALEVMASRPVDLVLLDLQMPVLDGFEVLERRRADEQLCHIPVVMISSLDDVVSVVRCIEMGAEDYLPKPFDPVLLRARLGSCLERKALRDQERALTRQLAEWNTTLEAKARQQAEEMARLSRLRRFLSPQLADAVVSSGADSVLQSHRRQIAVVFSDLRGFTAFAEVAEPEDVMAVLRDFHQAMGAVIHEFGATVGYFAGDGLMAFFNDPVPCPDPASRAVRMAVVMRDEMGTMCADWQAVGHNLGFGVGIAFGYATLGEIGFEGRFDYGVIGSVVNLAARLCDQAGPGEILISQRARREVDGVAEIEDRGLLTLAGFHDRVPAYAVVAIKDGT
jgi:class 3 adenylate cyclase